MNKQNEKTELVDNIAIEELGIDLLDIKADPNQQNEQELYHNLHKRDIRKVLIKAYEAGQEASNADGTELTELEEDSGGGVTMINTDALDTLKAKVDRYEASRADLEINLTTDEANNLGHELVMVINMIDVTNDLIDFYPNIRQLESDDIEYYYGQVQRSLGNVFRMNQYMTEKLDYIASQLYAAATAVEH